MDLDAAIVGVALLGLLLWWLKWKSLSKRLPPGSMGWPLLGETLDYLRANDVEGPDHFVEKRRFKYGDVFRSNILGRQTIVSADPDVNKFVLQNEGRLFRTAWPKSFRDIMGEKSFLNVHGEDHRKFRAFVVSTLGSAQLKDFLSDIEESVLRLLARWKDKMVIQTAQETTSFTFDLIAKQLMSLAPEEADQIIDWYTELNEGLFTVPIKFPGTRYSKALKARSKLMAYFEKIINARRNQPRGEQADVLDFILECEAKEGKRFPNGDLHDFFIGTFLAGNDTTAALITMIIKLLRDAPDSLENLKEEHDSIRRFKQRDEKLSMEDYKAMNFTQSVINEALRIANISAGVYRVALEDVHIKDYFIPKGWTVLLSFVAVHCDSNIYPNPFQFDPLRWQNKSLNTAYFTPFGGGPRMCAGADLARLEASVFLHHFVTQCSWQLAEEDHAVRTPVFKMLKGLPIIVRTREEQD